MVLTGGSISQRGKDQPNLAIHLTLTGAESPGQHSGRKGSNQQITIGHNLDVGIYLFCSEVGKRFSALGDVSTSGFPLHNVSAFPFCLNGFLIPPRLFEVMNLNQI